MNRRPTGPVWVAVVLGLLALGLLAIVITMIAALLGWIPAA